MKTPMRLVKEVPEIYVDQSRDMQLLLRLMDCVYGGVKFDIDSVLNLTRTNQCKSNYLQLLQSKVGFLSDKKFDLEDLRLALSAFPWLVKNKGSKKAIKQAVNAYLKMRHIKTNFNVNVINRDEENNVDKYVVQIGIEGNIGDTTILDEIFKYILPTGYEVEYVQYEQPETNAVELAYNDSIDYIIPSSGDNQTVGHINENLILQYPLVNTYNFVTLTPGATTFGGNPATVTKDGSTVSFSLDDNYIISCNGGSYSSTIGANLYFRRNMILEKGIKYTISCKTISGTVTPGILFRTNSNYWWEADDNGIYHATSTDLGAIKRYLFISGNTSLTFIIDNNIDISNGINIYQNMPSNYAPNQFSYCIKLEKGSTATPYSVPGERVDLMKTVGTQNLLEKEN